MAREWLYRRPNDDFQTRARQEIHLIIPATRAFQLTQRARLSGRLFPLFGNALQDVERL
jgi:hypothetical protein